MKTQTIQDLITTKINQAPPVPDRPEFKRFIVQLTDEMDDQIHGLALATRTGRIDLTSNLLKIALQQAWDSALESGIDFPQLIQDDKVRRAKSKTKNSSEDEVEVEEEEEELEEEEVED